MFTLSAVSSCACRAAPENEPCKAKKSNIRDSSYPHHAKNRNEPSCPASDLLGSCIDRVAAKFPAVKFVKIHVTAIASSVASEFRVSGIALRSYFHYVLCMCWRALAQLAQRGRKVPSFCLLFLLPSHARFRGGGLCAALRAPACVQVSPALSNFPPSDCPTVMVYHKGKVLQQFVKVSERVSVWV